MGEEEDTPENLDEELEPIIEAMEPQISMNVVCGNIGFQTMRINNHVGKKTIHILIDSESTHNFLDEKLARKLGCKLEPVPAQSVTIAVRKKLHCCSVIIFVKTLGGGCMVQSSDKKFIYCLWEVVI